MAGTCALRIASPSLGRQMRPILIGSEIYRGSSYGAKHPLAIPRVSVTLDLVRALGWLAPGQYRDSPMASAAELARFAELWQDRVRKMVVEHAADTSMVQVSDLKVA